MYVDMVDKIRTSADVSTTVITKVETCSFEERSAGETSAEVISNWDETESTGVAVSHLNVESSSESSGCCCSGNEGAASNVGASVTSSIVESESTCSPGGCFGDLEQIGMGMVNELLSVSESEPSCMNLESGCDGNE